MRNIAFGTVTKILQPCYKLKYACNAFIMYIGSLMVIHTFNREYKAILIKTS
jgi:predicted tellurium resistance membrane protein TerC